MTVDDEIAYNNYKLTADKILQILSQIRDDPSASAKRWVWELLQNAKDVPNRFGKVSVEIELVSDDILKFRHNGDPFTVKNITGLVQQVSSKDSQNLEGETGKFGTGFICTHLLSDIIDVEGVVSYKGVNRRFGITLDRSGDRSEDLLPRIETTLEELRRIETAYEVVENYEENRTEQSFDTVFTYHLTTDEKRKSAIAGLEDLINTLPITLVTQSKKIKQVRIINRVNGKSVTYKCDTKALDDRIWLSKVNIENVTKSYLSYITDEVALTIEVNASEGGYELVKRDSKQPVLYRDFPLIGSEKFYFPFSLNGFGFIPTQQRNGLYLNSADSSNCVANRHIVDKAVDAVIAFNQWLVEHHATNRYLLASSRIPESTVKYSEDVAAPWIKNLQLSWRKRLLDQELVETEKGTDKLANLSVPQFTNSSTKEINQLFYQLLSGSYIGRGVLPKMEHLHGWLEVVRPEYEAWGTKLKYDKDDFLTDLSYRKTLSALSQEIGKSETETIAWLNKVYTFMVEQGCLADFNKYAIIPNQKGVFKTLNDLKSDHSSRIPETLKSIYNSVNTDTIQGVLMDERVEASTFGNTLETFDLKKMIDTLNTYIKSDTTIIKNGVYIYVRKKVAYSLLALYPETSEVAYLQKRETIYSFCKDYRQMDNYRQVDVDDTDLWREADAYWFNNSYAGIANKSTIDEVATKFFFSPKTKEEALSWMDGYLKFYRDNAHGDVIKEKSIFPNQTGCLKKLSELRYDDNVAEEFKDLANYAAGGERPIDMYRQRLLHRAIKGYEQQNPLKLEEVYRYVKGAFDKGNVTIKEIIARHALAIMVKNEDCLPQEKQLYDFCKTISSKDFDVPKYIESASGFNWGFAQEFYISQICNKIAKSVNIEGFKQLDETLKDMSAKEVVGWIDSLIEFLHSYKGKKYWPLITDTEKGKGIWINQKGNFCKFQDVRADSGISEELKDLAANNRHVAHDFRETLFSNMSSHAGYLETKPMELKEIGEYIDGKLEHYEGNKQDADFRALVFAVGKLCKTLHDLEASMTYFSENKNSLIVWSLGEGETMDLVGSIIQQGDQKIKVVKEILEGNSLEDLQDIKDMLKGCAINKVKEAIAKIGSEIDNCGDEVEIEINTVPKVCELDVVSADGTHKKVLADQVQYSGLSEEEICNYVSEAKIAVVKLFRELDEQNHLGLRFDDKRIAMNSYSQLYGIFDKNGNEIPLVVHSYKGPQYRYFDLNWYDWEMLSKPGSMLWVLTVTGLQCIPLYALPVREIKLNVDGALSAEKKAALLTLGNVAKRITSSSTVHFEFGNNMPRKFNQPIPFDYVPEEVEACVASIKELCMEEIPKITSEYYTDKSIPLIKQTGGYGDALRSNTEETMREMHYLPDNSLEPPIVNWGASIL